MRGFYVLGVLIVLGIVACVVPFMVFPSAGVGVALPVIYVPGEHLEQLPDLPGGVPFTNTILAAIVTSLLGLLFLALGSAASPKEIPGRGQAALEMIVDLWDGFAKSVAGSRGRQLMPLILTIFFFLMIANLMKIIPGADTIGEMHCAGLVPNEEKLETAEEKEDAYVAFSGYDKVKFLGMYRLDNKERVNTGGKMSFHQYEGCKERLHPHEEDHSTEVDHGEEVTEEHSEAATTETAETEDHGEEATTEAANEEVAVATVASDEEDDDSYEARCRPEDNTDHGAECDIYAVTPFIRGASTDLTLTLAIAFVAMLLVQYFGIKELGIVGWGVKFINIPALGNGGIESINFVVGLLEVVLEVMKVVSFAFRLFGSMFAGQVLMFVITFLVGAIVPMAVLGLELFVGLIQAFVFAILFLMFATGAMTSHHDHDEAHEHH